MDDTNKKRGILGPILIAIFAILVLVIGWHLLIPVLGIAVAVTAGAWGVVVTTIVLLCLAALLLFVLPGVIAIILCVFALIWVVGAIILFPIMFPIAIPLLIIVWFIAYLRRRSKANDAKDSKSG